ncbi:hypothetical protein SS50377_21957 [Spironucleus salmonicida]|uniref:Uncharacterized protein n=1 Tax=Spironucleus salmonicida TaxID=348837 RepID=V6LTH5_9EUKA|nr:hypothetical protein SS50377_21957 [Spironucleus salmonicida]|eukprot:EST46996.1 Hypothetical protein SS50377_12949 [Spironucleus salmonicida]
MNPFKLSQFVRNKQFPVPQKFTKLTKFNILYETIPQGMRTTQTFESDLLSIKNTSTQNILENSERYTDAEFGVAASRYQFQRPNSTNELISSFYPKRQEQGQKYNSAAMKLWNAQQLTYGTLQLPSLKKACFGQGKIHKQCQYKTWGYQSK